MKRLKGDLRAGFEAVQRDGALRGLREHSDLIDAFIIEQLKRLGEQKVPPWGDAVEAFNDFETAKSNEARQAALANVRKVIRQGLAANKMQSVIRQEVRAMIQEQTKTLGAEWKRIIDLKAVLTSEQARAFADAVVRAAEKQITEKKALAEFYTEVQSLIGGGSRRVRATEDQTDAG
jgi:hypothetical protein